ncbi:MAG: hypothetical protein U0350_37000 [Caldilineaceae bacterium]
MTLAQTQAREQIKQLVAKYCALSDDDKRQMTEASVVRQFIEPLLEALGWPIQDPNRYKYELHTQAGRPDMTLLPEQSGVLFIEGKRFGLIAETVLGEPWDASKGAVDPVTRQQLRDELDALIAHLYGLSRADFAHILSTFPLVFPHDAAGQAKKAARLAVYERFTGGDYAI